MHSQPIMDADAQLRIEIEARESDIVTLRARCLATSQQKLAERDGQLQALRDQVWCNGRHYPRHVACPTRETNSVIVSKLTFSNAWYDWS